jgi:SAM-dependent methyltransferase
MMPDVGSEKTNQYSRAWFETFLEGIPDEVTGAEVAFLERVLPQPEYTHVLDLCCGSGRHAVPLTERGYVVTGLDRDRAALRRAEERLRGTPARLVEGDMRNLDVLQGSFDSVLIMWQSFGYFDTATNRHILHQIADLLRPGGRLVLDLYHRAFFEAHPGTRMLESKGRRIEETRWMDGDRLHVRLDYGDGQSECMEWQLFYPEEIVSLGREIGFETVLTCCQWDENLPPSPGIPRMQVVLGRPTRKNQSGDLYDAKRRSRGLQPDLQGRERAAVQVAMRAAIPAMDVGRPSAGTRPRQTRIWGRNKPEGASGLKPCPTSRIDTPNRYRKRSRRRGAPSPPGTSAPPSERRKGATRSVRWRPESAVGDPHPRQC